MSNTTVKLLGQDCTVDMHACSSTSGKFSAEIWHHNLYDKIYVWNLSFDGRIVDCGEVSTFDIRQVVDIVNDEFDRVKAELSGA
jgi:hypothetical protein